MAYTTINKSSDYFNTKLYTGNGSNGHAITGVGFQPDFVWIKDRDTATNHMVTDAVRGATKTLHTQNTDVESTAVNALSSFNTDGFTVNTDTDLNANNKKNVAWNWKANGAGSANTEGSVSATVSANTTAGFSIVQYNTAGSGTQTMGHGLDSAPTFIITKPTQNSESWYVYIPTGVSSSLRLNTTAAAVSSTPYAGTPTDTLFSINNGVIGGYTGVISYCFTDVKGYSKFGSYTGNGNADGPFVYTGFKPAFVMVKESSSTGSWCIFDNKRLGYNPNNPRLYPNNTNAEDASETIFDIVSNGFKIRGDQSDTNASGQTYIYAAFAEAPLVGTNNVPCTAR
tara:strand:+ start:168 stop:1190 length:1023 start_codon:yes stop_codon:yes gene_type:complete